FFYLHFYLLFFCLIFFFFFQAEDGIRDLTVTGVQTCALPIWIEWPRVPRAASRRGESGPAHHAHRPRDHRACSRCDQGRRGGLRSEERRVGKECRSGWAA